MKRILSLTAVLIVLILHAKADLIIESVPVPPSLAPKRAVIPAYSIILKNTGTEIRSIDNISISRKGTVQNDNFGKIAIIESNSLATGLTRFNLMHFATLEVQSLATVLPNSTKRLDIAIVMSDNLSGFMNQSVSLDLLSIGMAGTDVILNLKSNKLFQTINNTLEIGDLRIRPAFSGDSDIVSEIPEQIIGGFNFTASAVEAITIPSLAIEIESNMGDVTKISNAYLVSEKNLILAGPINAEPTGEYGGGILRFPIPIQINRGNTRSLIVKAQIGSSFVQANSYDVMIRLNIDAGKIMAKGHIYGFNFLPSQKNIVLGTTVAVRDAKLLISMLPPDKETVSQVDLGENQVAKIVLDATQSSEDIVICNLPIGIITEGMPAEYINNCQFLDGETAVNSGKNIVNPPSINFFNFTFDKCLTVPKGTVKILTLHCNIEDRANGWLTFVLGQTEFIDANGANTGKKALIVRGNGWSGWLSIVNGKRVL